MLAPYFGRILQRTPQCLRSFFGIQVHEQSYAWKMFLEVGIWSGMVARILTSMVQFGYGCLPLYDEYCLEEGLKPEIIKNDDIYNTSPIKRYIVGTWLWKKRPKGKNHVGNVIRVVAQHNTTFVVLLRVCYTEEQLLTYHGRRLTIHHDAHIEKFAYHKEKEAIIVIKPIHPKKISCVGIYNLLEDLRA